MQELKIGKLRQKQLARRAVFAATLLLLCLPMLSAWLRTALGVTDWVVLPLVAVVIVSWAWGGYHFFKAPCPNCQHAFAKAGPIGLSAWPEVMFRTECQHCNASWRHEPEATGERKFS